MVPTNAELPRLAFVNGGLGFGGATTLLCNLGGELVSRGVPVLVLSLERENPFASDFEKRGIRVVTEDQNRLLLEDRIRAVTGELAAFGPTAVVACLGPASYEVLRYVPAGVTRAGMVQADHEMFYESIARYAKELEVVIGVSPEICRKLEARPEFKHARVVFLTSGVTIPEKTIFRARPIGQPLRILYLGRLERGQKRVHLFPEILKTLERSQQPFIWKIVGEGSEKEWLKNVMRTSRPDQRVEVLGKVSYEEVPGLMEATDVFVLASDCEGLPLTLLEAMAGGAVPVVSDLASGIRDVVDSTTGRLAPPDDVSAYGKAIIELASDRALLERLSANAREKVARDFSTAAMADRWADVFAAKRAIVQWPSHQKILPPLGSERGLAFSSAGRLMRRLLLRLKGFKTT